MRVMASVSGVRVPIREGKNHSIGCGRAGDRGLCLAKACTGISELSLCLSSCRKKGCECDADWYEDGPAFHALDTIRID
jgi:hypothetical protein